MTSGIAIGALAAIVVVEAVFLLLAARRRAEDRARRTARLLEIVARIDAAVSSIGDVGVHAREHVVVPWPAAPDVGDGLPGRTALLQSLRTEVTATRSNGRRLSVAVVRAEDVGPARLAVEARRHLVAIGEVDAYAVGPRAIALVLPGFGRADALGVLARIEARCPSSGSAVELEPDEDAVELAVRLLAQGAVAA